VRLSADDGNSLSFGSDGGLYVPRVQAPAYLSAWSDTNVALTTTAQRLPLELYHSSGDEDASLSGNIVTLTRPGLWQLEAALCFGTTQANGLGYLEFSGTAYGVNATTASVYTNRPFAITAHDVVYVEDGTPAQVSITGRYTVNAAATTAREALTCTWAGG
jgi:hypothetical protein